MTDPNTLEELYKALDKISEYNKLGGRGHGDLEDTCYICGISPSKLKTLFTEHSKERETELLDALYWMYVQYCNGKNGHMFMSAGETASELLEDAGYIVVDSIGEVIKDNGDSFERSTQLKRNKGEDNGYTYEQKN